MWLVSLADDGVHVTPVDDFRPHATCIGCWCHPVADCDQPDVWTHNSLDNREAYERGERLLQ